MHICIEDCEAPKGFFGHLASLGFMAMHDVPGWCGLAREVVESRHLVATAWPCMAFMRKPYGMATHALCTGATAPRCMTSAPCRHTAVCQHVTPCPMRACCLWPCSNALARPLRQWLHARQRLACACVPAHVCSAASCAGCLVQCARRPDACACPLARVAACSARWKWS